jgi:DNA invertase Pin-like site-specific DNA recombinase
MDMPAIVVYLPRRETHKPELWLRLREWQKTENLSWERLRLTPDFWHEDQVERDELQGMLDLVRFGQVERLVYLSCSEKQRKNLDWMAFALSIHRYGLSVETVEEGILALDQSLHALSQSFESLRQQVAAPRKSAKSAL